MITHEPDDRGLIACEAALGRGGGDLASPGESNCGNARCRDLRARRKLLMIDPRIPADAAHLYAIEAYRQLRGTVCPGGRRHEGFGSSAEYCDVCLVEALAAAYMAGSNTDP